MEAEQPNKTIHKLLWKILDEIKGFQKRLVFWYADSKYIVDIRKYRTKRSIPQNDVLFMWFTYLEKKTGNPRHNFYRLYEALFQNWERVRVPRFGEFFLPKPVKTNNTVEFSEHMEKVRMDIQDRIGEWLPLPGEDGWDEFYASYKM